MSRSEVLLKIIVITDDDTGLYQIGELDFGKSGHCEKYLENAKSRQVLVDWLRWLADAAENGTPPFFPYERALGIEEGESNGNN